MDNIRFFQININTTWSFTYGFTVHWSLHKLLKGFLVAFNPEPWPAGCNVTFIVASILTPWISTIPMTWITFNYCFLCLHPPEVCSFGPIVAWRGFSISIIDTIKKITVSSTLSRFFVIIVEKLLSKYENQILVFHWQEIIHLELTSFVLTSKWCIFR